MKMLVLIAVATFFVVDTSATLASVDERTLWSPQCRNETGFSESNTLGADVADQRKLACFAACYLEKAGLIKDGKLADREKVVGDLAEEWRAGGGQPKEGRTYRQLAEKCYDEANAKTEKCDIGGAVAGCVKEGLEEPANSFDDATMDSNSSEE